MNSRVTKVVVPAAGLGTRFLPATKALPKEMLPVVDKPTIQYVVEEAVAAGLTDVLMITGRNKNALENHFDRNFELEVKLEEKGDEMRLERVTRSTDSLAFVARFRHSTFHQHGYTPRSLRVRVRLRLSLLLHPLALRLRLLFTDRVRVRIFDFWCVHSPKGVFGAGFSVVEFRVEFR